MIKKVAGGCKVLLENGKTKEGEKRLEQVEFFKHRKG
jgi:hypothetical protein